jgi:hypothetical protein
MENITPANRALAVLDTPAPTEPIAPRRISKRVRTAIDAMVSGKFKKISEAAEHVGLARESLSRALSTPHVAEHLRQKVLRHLAIQAARAGAVKGELLDSDNEMVRDRASSFVLGLAGIAPRRRALSVLRPSGCCASRLAPSASVENDRRCRAACTASPGIAGDKC